MSTFSEAQKLLREAGFSTPFGHPFLDDTGAIVDPADSGFIEVQTGGGCIALRRDIGDFFMLITSEDGCDAPDLQQWESNLIGIYREGAGDEDDREIVCVNARVWEELVGTDEYRPLTFKATLEAYQALLTAKPGHVLMQDDHNVAFLHGEELVGCTLDKGVVSGEIYDFDPSAFDDIDGCWAGAGSATRRLIQNPRYHLPQEVRLSLVEPSKNRKAPRPR